MIPVSVAAKEKCSRQFLFRFRQTEVVQDILLEK